MSITKSQVVEVLKGVIYFAKSDNIVNLGMLDELEVSETAIKFRLVFPKLGEPAVNIVSNAATKALHDAFGEEIKIEITPIPEKEKGRGPLAGVKHIVAIASGKGGVGKSTVAANLAVALAKTGASVGLIDADIYGPSVPMMLGDTPPVQIQDDRYIPVRVHGIEAMSIGYMTDNNTALIWRGPMLAKSLIQMLDFTAWHNLDYLCIDLPPGTGDIQLSLVQKIPLAGAVIVTTPQQIATLDAQKAMQMFDKTHVATLGIIENMSLHRCSQCGHHDPIFGQGGAAQLAQDHKCTLLGQLPLDSQIRQEGDSGLPSALSSNGDLANLFLNIALRTAKTLSERPLSYTDKIPPIVSR